MVRAYAHVPSPNGNVLATEIFKTGIITSDTDFRQFEQYGNLTGLDLALVENSYYYHTRKDLAENIQLGAIQVRGSSASAFQSSREVAAYGSKHDRNARIPHRLERGSRKYHPLAVDRLLQCAWWQYVCCSEGVHSFGDIRSTSNYPGDALRSASAERSSCLLRFLSGYKPS